MKKKVKKVLLFTLALIFVTVGPAFSALVYEYSNTYSGAAPSGPPPWMSATFAGTGSDTVTLTLKGISLASTEFVSAFLFNYIGSDPITIAFANPWQGASTSYSPNAYSAGGAGGFDIRISFPTSAQLNRFNNSDTAVLTITGTNDPSLFYATNAGRGRSGWATVPIPPTVWLLGAGLLGIVGIRRGFMK